MLEVGIPERHLCKTVEDASRLLSAISGQGLDMYRSVYHFEKQNGHLSDYSTAIVDKIFFDLDGPISFLNVHRLHQYLLFNDYTHYIKFSGKKGFHIFAQVINPGVTNKAYSLRVLHQQIRKDSKVFQDEPFVEAGDISRLHRVTNTRHPRSGLFCVNLDIEEFATWDEVKLYAKIQRGAPIVYTGSPIILENIEPPECIDNVNLEIETKFDTLPPCMSVRHPGHLLRSLVFEWLMEQGVSQQSAVDVVKNSWSYEKWNHSVNEEKQVDWIWSNTPRTITCNTMKKNGFCIGRNCKWRNLL